ncbi:Transmembrane domain-containing protein [Spironucleus salmonicida]|uniref:Transmembrane domain-containing protein n=1 Tax=Spironucleus salmonicida TaxID=348837 RepID=V6LCA1_9EUKA|nr:Transmembrane domain-containing protein [Spironucleus salmonicida]|eukprot:EST42097.1 Transmembrane domain-containing protein [Spironucleus salmonicida]
MTDNPDVVKSELSTHGVFLTTHNVLKMLFSYGVPFIISGICQVFIDYISAYFQISLFGMSFIIAYASTIPMLNIFTMVMPMAITTYFQIKTGWLLSQHKTELAAEQYEYYTRSALILAIIFTVGFASWSTFQINTFKIGAQFQTNYIVQLVFGFFVNTWNFSQSGRYNMESRRLLVFARGLITTIIFAAIESFCYNFFFGKFGEESKLESNWPTTLAYCLTQLICTTWNILLSAGYTALGVTTKEVFKNSLKELYSPKKFFSKESLKSVGQYTIYGLVMSILNMALPLAVLLCVQSIQTTFISETDIFNGITDIFIFYYFGSVFRVIPYSINQAFVQASIVCMKLNRWARIREMILKGFIIALVFNGIIALLFVFLPIIDVFIGTNKEFQAYKINGRMQEAILYSAIVGAGQILTELALSLSVIQNHFIVSVLIAIGKIIQAILSSYNLKKNNGDKADYLLVLLFTECNSIGTSLIFLIMYFIKFKFFCKEEGGNKKKSKSKGSTQKKKNADEILANE